MKKLGGLALAFLVWQGPWTVTAATDSGRIEGRVLRDDGRPLARVEVKIDDTSVLATTNQRGEFVFPKIAPGIYTLSFVFPPDHTATRAGVTVTSGATTTVEQTVEWETGLVEITVVGRDWKHEIEAPGSVTVVSEARIARQAADPQIPKLLQYETGIETTQSALYAFNVNARGFNDTVNTRIEVRLDGRDIAIPGANAPFWHSTTALDDLASVEFLRGPSSALYGANAAGGVIVMRSKELRDSQGGMVRLTAGELDSVNTDVRWVGELGNDWYVRVQGGFRDSEDFTVPRTDSAEYAELCQVLDPLLTADCLIPEAVAPPLDGPKIRFGGLRLDKVLSNGARLTFEGARDDVEGVTFHTGAGRLQFLDGRQTWTRFAYAGERWQIGGSYQDASAEWVFLNNGFITPVDSRSDFQVRAQTQRTLAGGRIELVAGTELQWIRTDSPPDPATGADTDVDEQSIFGQASWKLGDHLTLVAAARVDDSSEYDRRLSPKAGLIYRVTPRHTVRLTYSEGFRSAPIFGRHQNIDVAFPQDLQSSFCDPFGVDCGLGSVRVTFFGNDNLRLEEGRTTEVGYLGLFGSKAMLRLDVYRTDTEDFLYLNNLPQLGTPLGRLNPDFGPWAGTAEAEATQIDPAQCPAAVPPGSSLADCIRAAVPNLSNTFDGSPAIVLATYSNLGEVDSRGVDLGLTYLPTRAWRLDVTYSWFDSEAREDLPGLDQFFTPNTPENSGALGIGYSRGRLSADLRFRWVDDFRWVGGLFKGDIESYTNVGLDAEYRIGPSWSVGTVVDNVLDDEHYEAFGGNVLGRRALVYATFDW